MASVSRARFGPLWVLLAGSVSVMAISGCLWSNKVNELPLVVIKGPAKVHLGEPAEFTAEFTNNEAGNPTFEWGRAPIATCPTDVGSARLAPTERRSGPKVTWRINPEAPESDRTSYCTFVIATDARGAEGFQTFTVELIKRELLLTVPAQVTSSMPAKYSARFNDDAAAAGRAKFYWASAAPRSSSEDPCLVAEQSAREDILGQVVGQAEFESNALRKSYCVLVIAKDEFGAEYLAKQIITNITNGGPPAAPRLVLPKEAMTSARQVTVGIFSQIRVAAAGEGELGPADQQLKFVWSVKRPDGSTVATTFCPGAVPTESEICFDVAGVGSYRVDLTTEEAGLTNKGDLTLDVEDRPPCIRMTEPSVVDATGATTVFSLDGEEKVLKVGQVVDDGDPLPAVGRASEGTFFWTARLVGPETTETTAFLPLPNAIFSSYRLPAGQYRLGDQVEVRVDYRDRLQVNQPGARDLSHCKATDLSCETRPGSGCFLRVGWKVLYL